MQIDGVGFNDDIPKKMSREAFVNHEMHANHFKHLKADDKEKFLGDIYDLMAGKLTENQRSEISGIITNFAAKSGKSLEEASDTILTALDIPGKDHDEQE